VKKSSSSEEKIISIFKEGDAGTKVAELCRKRGMSDATFYKWKAKYAGVDVSQLRRLRDLETENSRLKPVYADPSPTHRALQDVVEKMVQRQFGASSWWM
jgi:putative transposase